MAYHARPRLQVAPQFVGANSVRQTAAQRALLLEFGAAQYAQGCSVHQLAELTGRSQSAVRRALDQEGATRNPPGAPPLVDRPRD